MKLLTPQKKVNFHGIELWVDKKVKTVAADNGGMVYGYFTSSKSIKAEGVCYMPYDGSDYYYICRVDLEGMDWRETKVRV